MVNSSANGSCDKSGTVEVLAQGKLKAAMSHSAFYGEKAMTIEMVKRGFARYYWDVVTITLILRHQIL